ncbi:hypothetical protein QZH41_014334 [Actinostola sp. cb2023]|nr:hypothetical protein QZH41_014334 [Actinostola sp. cb2023]
MPRSLICGLCNHKKALCLVVLFAILMIIVEYSFFSDNEGEYAVIDSVQDQLLNFEGKLDDPNYVIVDDVPAKSSAYDENWMDGYSEDNIFYDKLEHNLNIKKPAAYAAKHKLPIIVWWTHFTGGNNVKRCPMGECYITEARKFKTHPRTKAFMFYGTHFKTSDLPLPRLAHHEWGLFHEESPKNNPILHHQPTIELFNHTSTFRRHSDYPVVTQFLTSLDELLRKPQFPLHKKSQNRLASVVYIQSGCNPPSDRDAYVAELMKYIQIDSYGKCIHNKDLPAKYTDPLTMDDKGFQHIMAQYKFTLSMENAICDDYITEKLWRPMILGSVPIYRGSPSVNDWMPNNHSVILVDTFKHPKELAEHIKWLDKNDKEYLKYLEYKVAGITNKNLLNFMKERPWGHTHAEENFVTGFECLVCDRIHRNLKLVANEFPPNTYCDSRSLWVSQTCHVRFPCQ